MLDYGPGILAALIFVLAVVKPFGRNSFLQISLTKDRARRNAGRLPCRPRMRILSPKKRRAAIFATFLSRNEIDAFESPKEENARRTRLHGGGAGGVMGFESSQTGSNVREPYGASRK